jgi:single-strand DNA-binding protein
MVLNRAQVGVRASPEPRQDGEDLLEVMTMPREATTKAKNGSSKAHARTKPRRAEVDASPGQAATNDVRLRGRVTSQPEERELPSGTRIVTFRISVRRARTPMTKGSRQHVDWVDCSAWTAATRRSTSRWQVGDTVEVEGALRRRFHGNPGGFGSTVEIEISQARRLGVEPDDGAAQSGSAASH